MVNTKPSLIKKNCHDNSEVLIVKKDLEKIMEQLFAEKASVTSNNKELYHICKYSK